MATAKPVLYTRYQSKDGTYPIIIRLINGKKQKLHPTGEKILEKSWNPKGDRVKDTHPEADRINAVIDAELSKAKQYFSECKIKGRPIDLELAFRDIKSHSYTAYLLKRAKQYDENGQYTMKTKTERFAKELQQCFGREVYFDEIDADFLHALEQYMKKNGNVPNTRHKKFEHLSKFFGAGIRAGLTTKNNPFADYKIKTTPVKKDKLTVEELKALEDLELKPGAVRLARDLFLFSYYCKGIRFQTAVTMQKSCIREGRLQFRANKGEKYLSAVIHPKLKAIIDRYVDNKTEYIFPLVKLPLVDLMASEKLMKERVGGANVVVNRNLKTLAGMIGTKTEISFHISRHTFAWHLKQKSDNIHVIKEALAHSATSTTERYLKELDDEFLDKQLSVLYE